MHEQIFRRGLREDETEDLKFTHSKGFNIYSLALMKVEGNDYRFIYFKISHSSIIVQFSFTLSYSKEREQLKQKYKET